jgi:hypothetical protein
MKTLSACLAAAMVMLPIAAGAEPAARKTFEHEGSRYRYTVSEQGKAKILRGTVEPGGTSFRLRVEDDRVTGVVDGSRVSFLVSEMEPLASPLAIASRD